MMLNGMSKRLEKNQMSSFLGRGISRGRRNRLSFVLHVTNSTHANGIARRDAKPVTHNVTGSIAKAYSFKSRRASPGAAPWV